MTDSEREDWVNNDEGLYCHYHAWRAEQPSKRGIRAYVRANRTFIDEVIRQVCDGKKPAHYLLYQDLGDPDV